MWEHTHKYVQNAFQDTPGKHRNWVYPPFENHFPRVFPCFFPQLCKCKRLPTIKEHYIGYRNKCTYKCRYTSTARAHTHIYICMYIHNISIYIYIYAIHAKICQASKSWYLLALTVVALLGRCCRSCATLSSAGAPKDGKSCCKCCAMASSSSSRKDGGPGWRRSWFNGMPRDFTNQIGDFMGI